MKKLWIATFAAASLIVVAGCGDGTATATEDDKKALDKLAKEGIGTSNPPPGQGGTPAPTNDPVPANGKVDAP